MNHVVSIVLTVSIVWVAMVAVILVARPAGVDLRQVARLVPDTVRLLHRIARDRAVPRSTRIGVWLLLAHLLSPIDLIPDVLPVVGYADDAIVALWALRRIIRSAGPETVRSHWPGSDEALEALLRLAGAAS